MQKDEESEKRTRNFFENTKTFIFIATTSIGVTMYVHTVFATNSRVDRIEGKQSSQHKIQCLIAIKLGVDEVTLKDMCDLHVR